MGIPPSATLYPGMGTRGRCCAAADLSASCFACSRIKLIFCLVSADSSSDSRDFPPVERLILGFGDLEVGLVMDTEGDTFSSMDSLSGWVGDCGSCTTGETAGAGVTTDSIMLVVVVMVDGWVKVVLGLCVR